MHQIDGVQASKWCLVEIVGQRRPERRNGVGDDGRDGVPDLPDELSWFARGQVAQQLLVVVQRLGWDVD